MISGYFRCIGCGCIDHTNYVTPPEKEGDWKCTVCLGLTLKHTLPADTALPAGVTLINEPILTEDGDLDV